MALSAEDVLRVANLARLSLEQNEIAELTSKLGSVVGLIEQLSEANTDQVEPMVHAFELQNVLASDIVSPSLSRELALQNAPSSDQECFRVPAVLG
jgi:aspartyl-tRNA(Asn)/glutamyl-tRNA(Gln) amidotransferase subunit C